MHLEKEIICKGPSEETKEMGHPFIHWQMAQQYLDWMIITN